MLYKILFSFRRFFKGIEAIFSYARFLWYNHHDWDYGFLLSLMKFKMKRMEKFFRSKHCHVDKGEEVANEIRESIDLITKIEKDDFVEKDWEDYEKKYGKITLDDISTKASKGNERNKAVIQICELEEKRVQEAYDMLFSNLAKRIRRWWD